MANKEFNASLESPPLPSLPSLSIKDIFKDSRKKHPAKTYPRDAIQQHATKESQEVSAKYTELRYMVFSHSKAMSSGWKKMSPAERISALKTAWPEIPDSHRPEASYGKTPEDLNEKLPPDCAMLPLVNVSDLKDDPTLLGFIAGRVRFAPHTYASTELKFVPVGHVEVSNDRSPLLKMQLDDPDMYGTIVSFATETEATDFECEGKGLSPIAGLQVLYIQNRLYGFLLSVVKILLPGKSINLKVNPTEPPSLTEMSMLKPKGSMFGFAYMEPYSPRHAIQPNRPLVLVSDEARRARDRVCDMRENPNHFEDFYLTAKDHDKAYVPDTTGHGHPIVKTAEFARAVLQEMVATSHYSLVLWDQLENHLTKVTRLFDANPNGIDVKTATPTELVESIQYLHLLLEKLKLWVTIELRKFAASPHLRQLYQRSSSGEQITRLQKAAEVLNKRKLCHMLELLCGSDLNEIKTQEFGLARYYLEVLETFLRHPDSTIARKYITAPIHDAITKLWVLTECYHEFSKHPWFNKILIHCAKSGKLDQISLDINKATSAWDDIFLNANSDGFIFEAELGMPDNNRFYYNVNASEKRGKGVNMLCKAEANLDEFWQHVDNNLNSIVDNYQKGILQDLLDGGGKMHRTIPWDQRDHGKKEEPEPSFKTVFDFTPQPLSQIFHDSSKEITGNFDKSSITVKTKEKTHGVPAQATEEEAGPAREPSPEPAQKFRVNKKVLRTFRALFYTPGETYDAPKINWSDVKNALTKVGFAAEQVHGSQWQFTPSADLNLSRGISFHEPHPSDEVPTEMARKIGRRLNRAYGWEGSMFKAA